MTQGVRVLNRILLERGFVGVRTWLGSTDDERDLAWYWTHADHAERMVLGENYHRALRAARSMTRSGQDHGTATAAREGEPREDAREAAQCGVCGAAMLSGRCEACGLRLVAEHVDAAIESLDRAARAGEENLYRADGRTVRIRQQRAELERLRGELGPAPSGSTRRRRGR